MRRKFLMVFLIIVWLLLVIFIASEILVPRVASWYAVREIRRHYPGAGEISVSVDAFPALRLLFKQYSSLSIKVERINLKGVNFDSIGLKSSGWPNGTYEAVISEREINRFFTATSPYVMDAEIALEEDIISLSGQIDTGYGIVDLASASGTLEPTEERYVYIVPESIEIVGLSVPELAIEEVRSVMEDNPIFVVREDLPFIISDIEVESGKLRIVGRVDMEQALGYRF